MYCVDPASPVFPSGKRDRVPEVHCVGQTVLRIEGNCTDISCVHIPRAYLRRQYPVTLNFQKKLQKYRSSSQAQGVELELPQAINLRPLLLFSIGERNQAGKPGICWDASEVVPRAQGHYGSLLLKMKLAS
jgi:hypothetical protein